MSETVLNLEWTNWNPRPRTICALCKRMIGTIWPAEAAPPLPAHRNCYCLWMQTREPVNVSPEMWETADETLRRAAIRWVAWMIRTGIAVSLILRPLIPAANEYNAGRNPDEDEDEENMEEPENQTLIRMPGRVLLSPDTIRPSRQEYDCVFMQPGRVLRADGSESNWLIPTETIQRAAPRFTAVSSYLDHPEQWGWGDRQEPQVADLVGVTFDAHWGDNALLGGIRVYDLGPGSPGAFVAALLEQIIADRNAGRETPPIGLSAVFFQTSELDEKTGLRVTTDIRHVESVDFVYSPGARGYIRAALSAQRERHPHLVGAVPITRGSTPQQEEPMSEEHEHTSGEQIAPETNPPAGGTQPPARAAGPVTPASDLVHLQAEITNLQTSVQILAGLLAHQEEQQTVQGMGTPPRSRISVGPGSLEQVQLALEAMLAGVRPPEGIQPLSGIRELYHLLSGDYEMTGVYQPDRVWLATVSSSTMASITANALNKRVMTMFARYPRWWEPAITEEDFSSLQAVRWTMLGGVGELPTVAEGATYTELTWDDKYETSSFVKKGGYLGITLEAIDKDDTNRVRSAPAALAQAAWLTLGKAIAAIHTANGTLADGGALYNATAVSTTGGHANLGSSALSLATWRATKILMMKQPELNSNERLGALLAPRLIWVPVDLEDTAVVILATDRIPGSANNDINVDAEGETREQLMANARRRVITVPFWTDTNNWYAQADPLLFPSIGVAYRYGRTPEIFSVADPRAGLMFSNDVMPVKVRFFFAAGAIDWRGLYRHTV